VAGVNLDATAGAVGLPALPGRRRAGFAAHTREVLGPASATAVRRDRDGGALVHQPCDGGLDAQTLLRSRCARRRDVVRAGTGRPPPTSRRSRRSSGAAVRCCRAAVLGQLRHPAPPPGPVPAHTRRARTRPARPVPPPRRALRQGYHHGCVADEPASGRRAARAMYWPGDAQLRASAGTTSRTSCGVDRLTWTSARAASSCCCCSGRPAAAGAVACCGRRPCGTAGRLVLIGCTASLRHPRRLLPLPRRAAHLPRSGGGPGARPRGGVAAPRDRWLTPQTACSSRRTPYSLPYCWCCEQETTSC